MSEMKKNVQVSARLSGFDLSDYQMLGVTGIDIFRCGLFNVNHSRCNPREVKLKSQIIKLENEILEHQMEIDSKKLLLEQLLKELEDVKGFSDDKRVWLISSIEEEFHNFLEDDSYDEDVRNDLSEFYSIRRDIITINAMKVGKSYEDAISIFDEYLDGLEDSSVVSVGEFSY